MENTLKRLNEEQATLLIKKIIHGFERFGAFTYSETCGDDYAITRKKFARPKYYSYYV